ncbi:DUF4349 domain-containing protein [Streptacidiphilus sp. PB12-B1b]|uniref:DUF4349 domain-containing protein n=1 Tax=Streptacidiphilus sp. PB12-B1b TaxID=2705012 RepID=UPI0015F7945B|nr:DUF4349 domain-containing protein [Streptacidiphilus sp. PB12-B1b]QMU78643.1 DUF4349 domain-containing protein [Streptacidiphilus sp. PB12-B1b]
MAGPRGRRAAAALGVPVVAVLALGGCGQAGGEHASSAGARSRVQQYGGSAPQAATAPGSGSTGSTSTGGGTGTGTTGTGGTAALPTGGRALVYTGEMQLRTPGVDAVVAQAEQLVGASGGFVDSEVTGPVGGLPLDQPQATGSATADTSLPLQTLPEPTAVGAEAAQLVVRIPVGSYATVYRRLLGLGTVLGQERASQDVTEQVVDVASRLKTQQASVDRVRALMDRAQSIGDVVALEAALTQRESDLESLEAQQQALQAQTAMSTVTVQVFEEPPVQAAPAVHRHGAGTAALDALKDGWHGMYLTFRALLVALAAVLPFAVLLAALGGPALWLTRRLRRPRPPAPADAVSGPPQD